MSTTPAAKGTQQGVERVLNPPSTLWESMMGFQNQPTTLGGAGSNPAPRTRLRRGRELLNLPSTLLSHKVAGGGSEPSHTLPGSFRSGGFEPPPPTHL